MQHQELAMPPLTPGESWTIKIEDAVVGELGIFISITTPGGTTITVPMQRGGDVVVTAGSDLGTTVVNIDLNGDADQRTIN